MRFKFIIWTLITVSNYWSFCQCQDVEIEGNVKFGKDFFDFMQNVPNELKLDDKPKMKNIDAATTEDYKEIQMRNFKRNFVIESDILESLALEKHFISEFIEKLISEGNLKLKTLGSNIINCLDSTFNTNEILRNVTANYITKLNTSLNFIMRQKMTNKIEKEFYALDIVQTSNKIFRSHAKILADNIMANKLNNTMRKTKMNKLLEIIEKAVINEKQVNLDYVCQKVFICRTYPAYSDHVGELLREILKLPDDKLTLVAEVIMDIIKAKTTFFKSIMDASIAYKIATKFKYLAERLPELRKFLSSLHDVLIYRYKLFRSKDGAIKIRTMAVRILIDMIDKAFQIIGEDFVDIEFSNIMDGLKEWSMGKTNDIQTILQDYVNNIEDVLKFYWNRESKEEVKLLMIVIMTRSTEKNNLLDELKKSYLFKEGSKFVGGESSNLNLRNVPFSNDINE